MLGNGLLSPLEQRILIPGLPFALGLYDDAERDQLEALLTQCSQTAVLNPSVSRDACNRVPDYIYYAAGNLSMYDLRQQAPSLTSQLPFELYLNGSYSADVLTALHVENTPRSPPFSAHCSEVAEALKDDFMEPVVDTVAALLEGGLDIFIYVG